MMLWARVQMKGWLKFKDYLVTTWSISFQSFHLFWTQWTACLFTFDIFINKVLIWHLYKNDEDATQFNSKKTMLFEACTCTCIFFFLTLKHLLGRLSMDNHEDQRPCLHHHWTKPFNFSIVNMNELKQCFPHFSSCFSYNSPIQSAIETTFSTFQPLNSHISPI